MQFDALILDVDGTLWNSTGIVAKAWTKAVREGGGSREITAEMLQEQFGKTMKVIADNLLPELEPKRRYAIMDVCCVYEHEALEEDPCHICYPGVVDTIKELSKRTKLMIVSNCQSGYIELFLRKTGLEPYITDTECYGDTGKNKDENIRLVVERNSLKHPVYVGDTQGDCDAAAKAGVPFVFASYGFGQADHADAVIASFDELLSSESISGQKGET